MAAKRTTAVTAPPEAALPITIGTISEVLPKPVTLVAASVAAEIVRFHEAAEVAQDQAEVAEITDEETFGDGADVVKSINAQIKSADECRKSHTKAYDNAKETLMDLYGATVTRFTEAKEKLIGKMDVWQKAESKKRQDETVEKQRVAVAEAERLAKVQSALGDKEGAKEIRTAVETVTFAPAKIRSVGGYGAAAGTRARRFGTIVHKTVFINALLKRRETQITDALESIVVPQTVLDSLARDILDGKLGAIPGFEANKEDKLDVR